MNNIERKMRLGKTFNNYFKVVQFRCIIGLFFFNDKDNMSTQDAYTFAREFKRTLQRATVQLHDENFLTMVQRDVLLLKYANAA